MRYLKLFEDVDDRLREIEDKLQEIINSNDIDIDIDHIKDISASATDAFSGNQIKYDKYIDIGEENADGFESWQLVGDDRNIMSGDNYDELLNFYKLLFKTRKARYLTFVVNIIFSGDGYVSLKDNPDFDLFKEELKDIKSRCKGEDILFHDSLSDKNLMVNSITMTFRKRLNMAKSPDPRMLISRSLITDFDEFIKKNNISKEGESDLISLIVRAQEI